MESDTASEIKLEIGHVLFIDIVGYSQLLITQQSVQVDTLKRIVRGTAQFRAAEAEGKVLRLPTGDGAALVFRTTPEAPVLCALEIDRELKKHPELRVRMGIHSGPVSAITDLNEQANIAGAGINIAQRVMDCGDAGHILLSKHVAEDLEHYPRWQPYLHDLGECEVKHGVRVSIVNLYTEDVGNAALPTRLAAQKRSFAGAKRSAGLRTLLLVAAIILIGLGVPAIIFTPAILKSLRSPISSDKAASSSIPEKSIAVLPFENLSRDPDNAYFVEGIQDEILTRLSKIADLKVISRTSTQKYKSAPENLRDVARQLGVANILEGSVQKSNGQVRVNVQLINALTDAHLWADTYDRKLTDIFAVESEIAKTIAETLQAKLTGSEKRQIAKTPTANPEAYELYLKGRFFWNKRTAADLRKSIEFFNQAIEKDPAYAQAYAALAQSWKLLPAFNGGAPNDCFPQAEAAVKKALALDDTSSTAHAALASLKGLNGFDYPGAIAEYERTLQLNPNDATTRQWFANDALANIGQTEREIAEMKRAVELDPLSLVINSNLGMAYIHAGRLDDAIAQLRKTVELDPTFYYARYSLALALELKGLIPEAIAEYQKATSMTEDPVPLGMLGRLYASHGQKDEALKILEQLRQNREQRYTAAYGLALIYLGLGDRNEALNWLEQGYREHDGFNIGPIRIDPLLTPLHGDPRFEALAEKIVPASEFKSATASK
jgi:TolB-like protein/class 3 adenylate cyclase/Flp pilus assembly protein TadD